MNKQQWETWSGKRVTDYKGETFIATTQEEWSIRLNIWKRNLDNGCPCPMPTGHIMFN